MTGAAAPVTDFPGRGNWARDVTRGCACPWTHDKTTDTWIRNPAATCGIHTIGQLYTEEVRG